MPDLKDEEIRRALAAEALTYEPPEQLASETLAAAEETGKPGPIGRIRGLRESWRLRQRNRVPKLAFAGMALAILVGLYGVGSMFGLNGALTDGPAVPPVSLTEGQHGKTGVPPEANVGGHVSPERDMTELARPTDEMLKREGGGSGGKGSLAFTGGNGGGGAGGDAGNAGGSSAADMPQSSTQAQAQSAAGSRSGISAPESLPVPGPLPNAASGPGVIRTGDMEVRVKKGRFGTAWASATNIAGKHGGFVASSSADQVKGRLSRGVLTVRIPAANLDAAIADFQRLGRIVRMTSSSSDASSQLVDFDARIRAAQARELQLLELLRQARSVADSLQVSTALSEVRTEIESLQAQRGNLQSQVQLAALTVSVYEPQAAPEGPRPVGGRLSTAWDRALTAATITLSTIVIGAGFILPLVVLALVLWGGFRIRRRLALR